MRCRFKKNSKVFVYGPGKKAGRFYNNIPAFIIERDPFFKDYNVKFKDGNEDWVSPKHLRKPYERNNKR